MFSRRDYIAFDFTTINRKAFYWNCLKCFLFCFFAHSCVHIIKAAQNWTVNLFKARLFCSNTWILKKVFRVCWWWICNFQQLLSIAFRPLQLFTLGFSSINLEKVLEDCILVYVYFSRSFLVNNFQSQLKKEKKERYVWSGQVPVVILSKFRGCCLNCLRFFCYWNWGAVL